MTLKLNQIVKGIAKMKKFKIIELNLKNFKGIKDFTLNANGGNLNVWGRNEAGKTTIFDSFTWLLFGKDSMNRSQFEIKRLDEKGNVAQHGLDHVVEGTFEIDGKKTKLKRVYAEQWTKKQGESQRKITGHTNRYYINDEPVKAGEYNKFVSSIVSEEAFKLLTNPKYFNEHLSPKQKRETLIEIAGNVTDEEIAEGNKDLEKFIDRLEGRTAEGYKKIVREKRNKLNDELDKIPIRIDELSLTMPDVTGLDRGTLEGKIASIDGEIDKQQSTINDLNSGAEVNNKRKELSDTNLKLTEIENKHNQEVNQKVYEKQAKIQEAESNIKLMESKVEGVKRYIDNNKQQIERHQKVVQESRQEWAIKNSEEFQYTGTDTCPTCYQSLPTDQVNEAKEKALETFNKEKSEKLEAIQGKAESLKEQMAELEKENEKHLKDIEKHEKEIEAQKDNVEKDKTALEKLKESTTDVTESAEYNKAKEEKEAIKVEIQELEESVSQSLEIVKEKIAELEQRKKEIQSQLNKLDIADTSKNRLQELEGQGKDLARQLEKLDKELYLTEEYDRKRVNLLENKINSMFDHARFKLFEEQLNGGYRDVCQTLYNGVPYDRGLNNANQINVGLDIINTLIKHYGVQAPIFIDNAESVTDLIDVDTQVISLIVPPTFDSLPKESQDSLISLHGSYEKASSEWKNQNKQLQVEIAPEGEVA